MADRLRLIQRKNTPPAGGLPSFPLSLGALRDDIATLPPGRDATNAGELANTLAPHLQRACPAARLVPPLASTWMLRLSVLYDSPRFTPAHASMKFAGPCFVLRSELPRYRYCRRRHWRYCFCLTNTIRAAPHKSHSP